MGNVQRKPLFGWPELVFQSSKILILRSEFTFFNPQASTASPQASTASPLVDDRLAQIIEARLRLARFQFSHLLTNCTQIHSQTGVEDSSADIARFEKDDWSTLTGGQTERGAVWARLRRQNKAIKLKNTTFTEMSWGNLDMLKHCKKIENLIFHDFEIPKSRKGRPLTAFGAFERPGWNWRCFLSPLSAS